MKIKDLLDYELYFERLVSVFRGFKKAPVGSTVTIPEVVTKIGKAKWRIPEHPAIRED